MANQSNIDLLLKKGIITQEQIELAQHEVHKTGMPVEKALERLGFISEVDITAAVAESMNVPFMDLSDYLIDVEVIKLVPEALARKYKIVPLFKIGDNLTLAMVDPQNINAIDEARTKSGVEVIEPVMSTPDMIENVINQYYGTVGSANELIESLTRTKSDAALAGSKKASGEFLDAPIIKLVNIIIMQAVKERASDIHIEPEEDSVLVRYRIDGVLHEVEKIPQHLQSALASRIKVMAKMDIAETRKAQDGRIQLKMESKNLDIRVSSFPVLHGENIVLRILDKSSLILRLSDLGFSAHDLEHFDKAIRRPNGIILVTGPTGSGKTTTLYAVLSTINSIEKNIITIEDPVEYEIPLVRQTQINPKAGIDFSNGLRNILRQDPDIIMVGEIRDRETVDIAIHASLTGHLVFSTFHTNDTASALTRLLDMGIEPFLISSSIVAILAQRLVRVICPKCKEQYYPSKEMFANLVHDKKMTFYRGKGCRHCKGSGLFGRIAIYEFLAMNDAVKQAVVSKVPAGEIKKIARAHGMRTLYEDGIAKVKAGITTIEEVLRVTEEAQ